MPKITDRLQHAWNAFMNRDPTATKSSYDEPSYFTRPDRVRLSGGNEKSIVTAIFNRIAMDVSAVKIQHVQLDEFGRYSRTRDSGLNECLTVEANLDQTGRALIHDIVLSMFDEGAVAVVPVETNVNPYLGSYDILKLRTGKIVEWFPSRIKVRVYDERSGTRKDIVMDKKYAAIIENPLYSIVNESNSIAKRLMRKLSLLDIVDEEMGAGKFNMIIQLPYIVKTDARKQQAELRKKDLEMQIATSKYGIAYIDGTEKVTQLNRALDNNLAKEVEDLTNMLYSQLGITASILDGSATEQEMINYNNRTIEPIVSAITDEFYRKFLTKTARTQGQSIMSFKDPFKLAPVSQLADLADRFTRNEIMTSNEIRQILGMKPAQDPDADELRNKNLNKVDNPKDIYEQPEEVDDMTQEDWDEQFEALDDIDSKLDSAEEQADA